MNTPTATDTRRLVETWSSRHCAAFREWALKHIPPDARRRLGETLRPGKADAGVPRNWRRQDLAHAVAVAIAAHDFQPDALEPADAASGHVSADRRRLLLTNLEARVVELETACANLVTVASELQDRVRELEARAFREAG